MFKAEAADPLLQRVLLAVWHVDHYPNTMSPYRVSDEVFRYWLRGTAILAVEGVAGPGNRLKRNTQVLKKLTAAWQEWTGERWSRQAWTRAVNLARRCPRAVELPRWLGWTKVRNALDTGAEFPGDASHSTGPDATPERPEMPPAQLLYRVARAIAFIEPHWTITVPAQKSDSEPLAVVLLCDHTSQQALCLVWSEVPEAIDGLTKMSLQRLVQGALSRPDQTEPKRCAFESLVFDPKTKPSVVMIAAMPDIAERVLGLVMGGITPWTELVP